MQPDSPQQPTSSSIEYLNQISAPTQQKTLSPILLWAGIGGILLLLVIAMSMIFSGGGSTTGKDRLSTIAAQLSALQTTTGDATENIQDSSLRTLNSSLSLALTNINHDIVDAISALEASTDEKDKNVMAVTSQIDELSTALEDARLNAVYDRTYAREIAYYLKTLHSEMNALYTATQKTKVRTFLSTADKNLSPFVDEFANYNGN